MSLRLIHSLLMLESEPRFHGNGFLQLQLNPMTRLHIWHKDLPPIHDHNAAVHDHRFDMHSKVLAGRVVHRTYQIVPISRAADGMDRVDVYMLTGDDNLVWVEANRPLEPTGTYVMDAGSEYMFPHRCYHESEIAEGVDIAVTLMTKTKVNDLLPFVLVATGEKPKNAFGPEYAPTKSLMWKVISEAIEALPLAGEDEILRVLS